MCLTASVGKRKEKGGWKQGRGKKRTRDSLKHCLYAFESRTTPLTSKCFTTAVCDFVSMCVCVRVLSECIERLGD